MALDIVLDPRNEEELLNQAARYIFEKSNGALSNLNVSNPLIFLLEAQVFAGAELLWYANQLPDKLLLYFLSQFHDLEVTATRATGTLTLNLTSPLGTNYIIDSLEVSSGDEVYRLVSPVTFTAGNTQTSGLIEAIDVGSRFNKPPFSVNSIVTPRPFLTSVTNLNNIEGGLDELTPQEAIDKYTDQFKDSQLISIDDYRSETQRLVGSAYPVRVVYQDGIQVLIGNNPSIDLIRAVQQSLEKKSILTANLAVQKLIEVPLDIYLSVQGDQASSDEFYQYLLQIFTSGISVLSRDTLIEICVAFGYKFIDGFFDVTQSRTRELNVNEIFVLNKLQLDLNGLPNYYGNFDPE